MIRLDEAGYPIFLGAGLIDRAAQLLPQGRFFIVTDTHVDRAGWTDRVSGSLGARMIAKYVVDAGESSKSFSNFEALLNKLIESGVDRSDYVLALGGGMVGDLAGFAAAVLKRGCGFVQMPTTLLAQADSAIGGKTGINTRHGKNLIGAFHQPAAVLIDVATLATLAEPELRSGYAEVVKYGLIGDAAFFAWCEENGSKLLGGDAGVRLHAVSHSVRAKISYVAGDERDRSGQRALLNFGHTFGHAVEAETGIRHGEAVAIGMVLAFRLSVERGLCPAADAERVEMHLRQARLPIRIEGLSAEAILTRMMHDKKREGERLKLVLARGIGRAFVDEGVAAGDLAAFLERELRSTRIALS